MQLLFLSKAAWNRISKGNKADAQPTVKGATSGIRTEGIGWPGAKTGKLVVSARIAAVLKVINRCIRIIRKPTAVCFSLMARL